MAEVEQPAAAPLQEKEIEPKERKGTTGSQPGQHGLCSAGADGAEACPPSAWSPCSPYGPTVRKLDHKDHTPLTSHFTGIPTATGTEQALVARCGDQPQHPFRVVPPSRPFLYCLDLWFTCAVRIEKCSIFPSHTDSFSGILALVNWIEDSEELCSLQPLWSGSLNQLAHFYHRAFLDLPLSPRQDTLYPPPFFYPPFQDRGLTVWT